jgi:hypothetical protein
MYCGDRTAVSKGDNVNHPSHYNRGNIEVIEFIEDQQLGMHLGNAVKYICRAGHKSGANFAEDLKKAIWYIRRHREIELARAEGRKPCRPNEMKEV